MAVTRRYMASSEDIEIYRRNRKVLVDDLLPCRDFKRVEDASKCLASDAIIVNYKLHYG